LWEGWRKQHASWRLSPVGEGERVAELLDSLIMGSSDKFLSIP
jgi:hypothetical protein